MNNKAHRYIVDDLATNPGKITDQFKAQWIATEKMLGIPDAHRMASMPESVSLLEVIAEKTLTRYKLFTWPQMVMAWNEAILDCQRDQAEGKFPQWNFGLLEAGLQKHLRRDPLPAAQRIEAGDGMTDAQRAINAMYENPTDAFCFDKARELHGHMSEGREFMIVGHHLKKVYNRLWDSLTREEQKQLLATVEMMRGEFIATQSLTRAQERAAFDEGLAYRRVILDMIRDKQIKEKAI